MKGKSEVSALYAVRDTLTAYRNRKLTVHDWRRNLAMARSNSKLRWAKENAEGYEKSHALTDINRKVIKKKMMTTREAYERNKVTKQFGLAWVLCG